jgi:hypothetical protein
MLEPVRALQHALYRAAKADPGRRFHALRDKVFRRDVLWRAWVAVRRNNGAPGIDKTTLDQVEQYGVSRLPALARLGPPDRVWRSYRHTIRGSTADTTTHELPVKGTNLPPTERHVASPPADQPGIRSKPMSAHLTMAVAGRAPRRFADHEL